MEVDKTRKFYGITENSDKYENVRGIVKKTRNFWYILTNYGLVTEIVPSLIHEKVKEFRIYLWFINKTRKRWRCHGQLLLR